MEVARQAGKLSPAREKSLNQLISLLPQLLPHENPSPSLLHGDLWGGNVMILADGRPALIDPAVYYGHREVEIAFTQLFGGFSQRFYDSYNAVYLLDKGYGERRLLYQLYPLMVHMNLFGGGYIAQVDEIIKRYTR
jgi:fructosamine-3-kinase